MRTLLTLADRTAVLFLGVAAGVAIGYAFADGAEETVAPPPIAPVPGTVSAVPGPIAGAMPQAPTPATAPPPPTGSASNAPAPAVGQGAVAAAVPASAPIAGCVMPPRSRLLGTVADGRRIRVGVFGDSYGDGIWSALYHLLPAKDGYEVEKFSRQSTGFTRYASLNLEQHAREQMAGNPIDIAVVSFGANDTQGVLSGNHAARLLGPEWQEIVGKRVDGFVNALRQEGAMVYWVGLPKMRKPQYDADIAGMNAFYARRMAALGVPWIETASLTVDADGQFSPYLPDGPDNERTLIRAGDGIHMSMTGYIRITRGLTAGIRRCVVTARKLAGVPDPAARAAVPIVRPPASATRATTATPRTRPPA